MLHAIATAVAGLLIGGHGGFATTSRLTMPRMQESLALTPQLIELGCDEALWSEVRNKQALLDMVDNEEQCRKRIEFLKRAVATGDDGSAPSRKQARLAQPFTLFGEAPEGIDVAAVEALLAERVEAKKVRDFERADEIRAQLLTMEVYINDKQRSWSKAKTPSGGFSLKGPAPEGVDIAAVEAILEERTLAKKARDFGKADELQEQLTAMEVFVNDRERTWQARKEKREIKNLGPFTLVGAAPAGVDVSAVEALLAQRVECKKARDYDGSDKLQATLLKMGVYVKDRDRTWEAAQWVEAAAEEAPKEGAAADGDALP